jgi:hypothetical protein
VTIDARALRNHAAEVSDASLVRMRGRLRDLSPDERRAVEQTAHAVGRVVADGLLEQASSDKALAAVLSALYPVGRNGYRRG